MDFFIGLMVGLLIGGFVGIGIAALVSANGRSEPEPDGVDDVLGELFQMVKVQPKPYHDEERKEDFKRKFPQEDEK